MGKQQKEYIVEVGIPILHNHGDVSPHSIIVPADRVILSIGQP